MSPLIAVVTPDTLAAIGLSDLIERMMPGSETCRFSSTAELRAFPEMERIFHFFVAAEEVISDAAFYIQNCRKTIVLVQGTDCGRLPGTFHSLNVCQDERALAEEMMGLARRSHTARGVEPEAVRHAREKASEETETDAPRLTPRETEVLRGIVEGLINKEIADRMGVTPATVITHRKNMTEKLGTRSVAALTIYAVSRGIVTLPMIR